MHFRCIAKMQQTAVMTTQGMYEYVCWMLSGMRFRLYIQFLDTLHWYSVLMHGYCHTAWYQVSSLRLSFRFAFFFRLLGEMPAIGAPWTTRSWNKFIKSSNPTQILDGNYVESSCDSRWLPHLIRLKKTLFQFKKNNPKTAPQKILDPSLYVLNPAKTNQSNIGISD